MVNTAGIFFSQSITPTMRWCIISDTYRSIDWLMNYICSKYPEETIRVIRPSKTILFDDGIDINEFIFVNNDISKVKGIRADSYIDIDDFREMWLLQ